MEKKAFGRLSLSSFFFAFSLSVAPPPCLFLFFFLPSFARRDERRKDRHSNYKKSRRSLRGRSPSSFFPFHTLFFCFAGGVFSAMIEGKQAEDSANEHASFSSVSFFLLFYRLLIDSTRMEG